MDLKEIEAKIAELEALKIEALREEEEKKQQALREEEEKRLEELYTEAVILYPELINILRRLNEIGYLPQRLTEVLTDASGKVNPGMYIKRPRKVLRPRVEASQGASTTHEPHDAPPRRARRSKDSA